MVEKSLELKWEVFCFRLPSSVFWQLIKALFFSFTFINFRSYCEVKRRDVWKVF